MRQPPLTIGAWMRYDAIQGMLKRFPKAMDLLEVGTGEGAMGTRLARRYRYVGIEPDDRSAAKAKQRIEANGLGRVFHGDISVLPPDTSFDLICAFEVLEHIEDDKEAIRAWRSRIRDGGGIVISVPAFRHRYGPSDRWVGHHRRYEPEDIAVLLSDAGFGDIDIVTYGFPLGYILDAVRNRIAAGKEAPTSIDDRSAASGRWMQPPQGIALMTMVAAAPFRLLQKPFRRTRLGIGLVASGRLAVVGSSR